MTTCSVCDKVCKSEKGLLQHMEMKHGKHGVHCGVSAWEDARRQAGELTTGAVATNCAYEIDDDDFDYSDRVWRCSMPGCAKAFSDKNGCALR